MSAILEPAMDCVDFMDKIDIFIQTGILDPRVADELDIPDGIYVEEDPLSEDILKGKFKDVHKVKVILEGNSPVFVEAEEAAFFSSVN